MQNYELVITYIDGAVRQYDYHSLADSLTHAVEIAARDEVQKIEVWKTDRSIQFRYVPPPKSRAA